MDVRNSFFRSEAKEPDEHGEIASLVRVLPRSDSVREAKDDSVSNRALFWSDPALSIVRTRFSVAGDDAVATGFEFEKVDESGEIDSAALVCALVPSVAEFVLYACPKGS